MNRYFTLLLSTSLILAGCAMGQVDVPEPIGYNHVWQRKMQAAYHWNALAEYQAGLIMDAIKDPSRPIFIDSQTEINTPFAQAYHGMLQTNLVRRGALIVTEMVPNGVMVKYTAQVVDHKDRGKILFDNGMLPGQKTEIVRPLPPWSYRSVDHTEVIITTQVLQGALVMHSSSDVFYYNAGDTDHYFRPYHKPFVGTNVHFRITDKLDNSDDL
ncbi:hypothetical protein TI04_01015 [Achromatium sp. WMS2]|nr:hypothetical protein TI04_01015 [Achromatium sp. WMS2]